MERMLLPEERFGLINQVLRDNPGILRSSFAAVGLPEPGTPEETTSGSKNTATSDAAEESAKTNAAQTATKFGGNRPYLAKDSAWPKCSKCEASKDFVCQINLAEIPKGIQTHIGLSSGLFQMFYCFECGDFAEVFDDLVIISQDQLNVPSLLLLAGEASTNVKYESKNVPESFKKFIRGVDSKVQSKSELPSSTEYPEKLVRWEEKSAQEIMNYEEFTSKNFVAGDNPNEEALSEQYDDLMDLTYCEDVDEDEDEEDEEEEKEEEEEKTVKITAKISGPASGIKLGGYVRWCQGVEYPTCPDCNVLMDTTFLQMEPDDLFNNSWGDCGTAHVTLCPSCKKPGLGWACG